MSEWSVFVLGSLVVARVTRLVTTEDIANSLREVLVRLRLGGLSLCNFCAGFWIAGAVFIILWRYVSLPLPGLWWPALAWTGAWLAGRE